MKYTIVLLLSLLVLGSCCKKYNYKYKIFYIDGTTEIIDSPREMSFGDGDCIGCGCGGDDTQRCGVKKLDLLSKTEVNKKNASTAPISDDKWDDEGDW